METWQMRWSCWSVISRVFPKRSSGCARGSRYNCASTAVWPVVSHFFFYQIRSPDSQLVQSWVWFAEMLGTYRCQLTDVNMNSWLCSSCQLLLCRVVAPGCKHASHAKCYGAECPSYQVYVPLHGASTSQSRISATNSQWPEQQGRP